MKTNGKFTNDDLGRYKRELDNLSDIDPLDFIERSKALIVRLEAAENAINLSHLEGPYSEKGCPSCIAVQAWRKAAGK